MHCLTVLQTFKPTAASNAHQRRTQLFVCYTLFHSVENTMVRFVLVAAVCSLFFCEHALSRQLSVGSSARQISLGGGPVNPYLRDIMRVHTNPAVLAEDSNTVWGDLGYLAVDGSNGGSRYQFLGAGFSITDRFSAGVMLNKRESPLYIVDASTPALDPIDEMSGYSASVLGFGAGQFGRPLSPIELLATLRLDSVDVGGSISHGGWKNESSSGGKPSLSAQTWRVKLGLLAPRILSMLTVDASVLVGFNSVEGTNNPSGQPSKLSMDGGTELGLDVRGEYPVHSRWTVVPRLRWYTFSWGMNQVRNGVPASPNPASEYSHDEYELGVGLNYQRESVLIAGGLSLQQTILVSDYKSSASSNKTTTTISDLPKINLGAEIRLASWLEARVGYFDRLASTETAVKNSAGTTTTTVTSELPWYGDPNGLSANQQRITIGIGIGVAGLCFDATLGEGYFLNGPWPLSGTAQQMFGVASISYRF
jgi:hypothetical protein